MPLQALCAEGHKQDRITIQHPMSQLFETVANQFQSNNQYQKFIRECEKEYDIKFYRLASFSVSYARKIYTELNTKYRDETLQPNPSGWYENERRLYVWFVLCFMHYKVLDPSKFIDSGEKYWRLLSEAFWQKEVYFLKYQLLNLFKAKGRIVWRSKEDQLLRKVFRNFKFGEWNEVAKEFYRESNGEFFKTPKQCRERWQNHLNEDIKKGAWTREEDLIIFEFIAKNQRKNWAQIVKNMNETRTEHMIKNRYKSLTTKVMAQREVGEDEAAKTILANLQGKPQKEAKDEQEEFVIQEVESQLLEEEGQKVERIKSPRREVQPQGSNKMMSLVDSNCMRVEGRDSQINPFWDNLVRYDSVNAYNISMSNYGSSLMLFDSGKFFKAFPLLEMPKEQERKNTIFDPSESYKSTNSVKNVDSIIVKIINSDN